MYSVYLSVYINPFLSECCEVEAVFNTMCVKTVCEQLTKEKDKCRSHRGVSLRTTLQLRLNVDS